MATFGVGDLVEVIDETITGVVVAINGERITLKTEDDFLLVFEISQLVRSEGAIEVTNYEAYQVKSQKSELPKKKVQRRKPKERNAPKMEVDLHIHQLTASTKGMSNFDILNLQLETAKRQLEFAIRKRIAKIVFIHGVGEGVLKTELNYLFKKYPVDFYDADYQKYGLGATEVYIYQNP
ncbi:MAG: DNA mismatch repair protein MutS [Bacteroidota bacterium]